MAKDMYIGVNNVAQKIKKAYVGVNGVAKEVKNIYIGVNDVAKKVFSSSSYTITPLSANDFAPYDTTSSGYTRYKSGSKTYHIANSIARATITFEGYSTFVVVIRSEAESSYDYTVAGVLDAKNISKTTSGVQGYTSGKQSTDVTVTYSGIDGGKHTIEIIYAKDSSVDTGNDCGYFYVNEAACKTS